MPSIAPYINMIIALLGLSYPILLQVIARLDERYESENITALFKTEWEWKAFRYTLVASLISVGIWSLELEPKIKIVGLNHIIRNSASILIMFNTTLLVVSFFFFVKKVIKYYTPYSLVPYLISSHQKTDIAFKYFSPISDLLLLSIKRQQTNISRTLSDFFFTMFKEIRDKPTDEPIKYPDQYYDTVYRAIEELAILKDKRNYLLEHRTSGGIWLLGETQGTEISDTTYNWLWRNLLLAIRYEQDDLIINHWETCHNYYQRSLPFINEELVLSNNSFQVGNKESVHKRDLERQKFIEFHYALGGLLVYKQRYSCLKRLFAYTQSQPPKYELLPESMDEIFSFYFDIRDPHERKYSWISNQYPFPELSGLNADYAIKKWIASYMAFLFLRQYTIVPYMIYMKPLDSPTIPNTQGKIKEWIDGLDYFKELVNEHLQNEEFLKALNFDFITDEWCLENQKVTPVSFIETFRVDLETAYNTNARDLELSDQKIAQFYKTSKEKIEPTIASLQSINNTEIIQESQADKWYVNGRKTLQSKDIFSLTPEADHINFDSFLAETIVKDLDQGFATSFLQKTSRSYLLKPEDLFKAVDKLGADSSYVIVNFGINLDHLINQVHIPDLSKDRYKNISIHSFRSSRLVRESLFVLKKSDLPITSTKPIEEEIISKYSLQKISDIINLYASVVDLNNTNDEIFTESKQNKSDQELRESVLLGIFLYAEFKWRRSLTIIQLMQYSEFSQNGIINKLEEVKAYKNSNRGPRAN